MRKRKDENHHFVSMFNEETGAYIRSGIIINGNDSGEDPFMSSFPELLDVGVMGHCEHGIKGLCRKSGVQCYQSGGTCKQPDMSIENFKRILDECHKDTYQIALGGRGDPDMHKDFAAMLALCQQYRVVPNFTTSGYGMTKEKAALCKKYCGAVAVSWYRSSYTAEAIDVLLAAGVKTNIHYVLGNNSISEAITLLKTDGFPKGINAIVFLLHKPVGFGTEENVLQAGDPKVEEFFHCIDKGKFPFKIGFDSCSVPGLLHYCPSLASESVDTCEGARWSAYISPDMKMMPCSFDNEAQRWAVDLENHTIQEAWDSAEFEDFRYRFRDSCPGCSKHNICMGGCPIAPQIVLCREKTGSLTAGNNPCSAH